MTVKVGIYVFKNVEVLDFAGPYEVFSTASRVKARLPADTQIAFDVFTVAEKNEPVRARGGLVVLLDKDFSTHPKIDVLIVPGGIVDAELSRSEVVQWIQKCADTVSITASVCTGVFLLAKAKLLENKSITTHWEDILEFQEMFPGIQVQENVRWVDSGNVVTSAGISAGIDMSLHLVARLESKDLAQKTARQMEFVWQQNP